MKLRFRSTPFIMPSIIFALTASTSYSSESQTLADVFQFSKGEIKHGGFGGPKYKYAQIAGNQGNLIGGQGAWMINKSFFLGGGGTGLANNHAVPGEEDNRDLDFYYSGLMMGYNFMTNSLVHPSVSVLTGRGAIRANNNDETLSEQEQDRRSTSDSISIIEPEVAVEINVTHYLRVNLGASYRFVGGNREKIVKQKDLEGYAFNLAFNFGSYR